MSIPETCGCHYHGLLHDGRTVSSSALLLFCKGGRAGGVLIFMGILKKVLRVKNTESG